ncbi:MAG: penicillin-binding protein 2 [Cyanobacteria bacterium SIG30]|nr:penicillin-binding protein 2 [Cyanobacteria bacterium SIG30]
MNKKNNHRKFDDRVKFIQGLITLVAVFFVVYLFAVQVFDARHYRGRTHRTKKLFVLRGEIVDRNGLKLATDVSTFNLYAHLKNSDCDIEKLAETLAPHLNTTKKQLVEKLSKKKRNILLKKELDRKTANIIREKKIRELSLDETTKRVYPQGILAAHVLGYYNPNADIAGGVEQVAKEYLEDGGKEETFERTGTGSIVYEFGTNPEKLLKPQRGKTLTLTIDSAIQHVCEKALYKKVKEKNAKRGTAIVMDPTNGEILAFAVYPYYNPNEFRRYSDEERKNWALTDVYSPGSTFKIITVASGFISGQYNKNSKILDTGKMTIGKKWEIKNHDLHKNPYPGLIDLVYLFKHSSNVGAVKIAQSIPMEQYYGILRSFNYGSKTGIDLPSESSGLLPDWKKWNSATHGAMGHGYASSVTAIQMVSAISAIANKGVWVTPHVIKYTGEEFNDKIAQRRIMEEQQAKDITDLLVKAVEQSPHERLKDFTLAAKTGTSQKINESGKGYSKTKLYTSTIGFLPASNPKAVIYVVVDSAQGGDIWGSTVALPVFKEIAIETAKILNMTPDKIQNNGG